MSPFWRCWTWGAAAEPPRLGDPIAAPVGGVTNCRMSRFACPEAILPLHWPGQPIVVAARSQRRRATYAAIPRAGSVRAEQPAQGADAVCYLCWSGFWMV